MGVRCILGDPNGHVENTEKRKTAKGEGQNDEENFPNVEVINMNKVS